MKYTYTFFIGLLSVVTFSQSADILLNGTTSAENNQIKNILNPTIIGHSMGGKVALQYAELFPKSISQLVGYIIIIELYLGVLYHIPSL